MRSAGVWAVPRAAERGGVAVVVDGDQVGVEPVVPVAAGEDEVVHALPGELGERRAQPGERGVERGGRPFDPDVGPQVLDQQAAAHAVGVQGQVGEQFAAAVTEPLAQFAAAARLVGRGVAQAQAPEHPQGQHRSGSSPARSRAPSAPVSPSPSSALSIDGVLDGVVAAVGGGRGQGVWWGRWGG